MEMSAKKLKQAQLPFLVGKSPTAKVPKKNEENLQNMSEDMEVNMDTSSDGCDKENNPAASNRICPILTPNKEKGESKPPMIDLTENLEGEDIEEESEHQKKSLRPQSVDLNRSIEETIDEVVRKASISSFDQISTPKETCSAKKKRRRSKTTSPIPPDAKRPILSKPILPSEDAEGDKTDGNSPKSEIPIITITAATPAEKPRNVSKRESILTFLGSPGLKNTEIDGNEGETTSKKRRRSRSFGQSSLQNAGDVPCEIVDKKSSPSISSKKKKPLGRCEKELKKEDIVEIKTDEHNDSENQQTVGVPALIIPDSPVPSLNPVPSQDKTPHTNKMDISGTSPDSTTKSGV